MEKYDCYFVEMPEEKPPQKQCEKEIFALSSFAAGQEYANHLLFAEDFYENGECDWEETIVVVSPQGETTRFNADVRYEANVYIHEIDTKGE